MLMRFVAPSLFGLMQKHTPRLEARSSSWQQDALRFKARDSNLFSPDCVRYSGQMTVRNVRHSRAPREPQPGEWIKPAQFANIVRLTPLVAIDLIARSPDGRVLVGRRTNEPAKDLFFVPGSRISKNETRAAAFRRITQEELGVEMSIETATFVGVYDHIYPTNRFGRSGFGTHYVTLAYELAFAQDIASLPTDQHGEYLWMTPAELLRSVEVHENTKAYFTPNAIGVGPNTSRIAK